MLKRYQAQAIGKNARKVKVVHWKNNLHDLLDEYDEKEDGSLSSGETMVSKEFNAGGARCFSITDVSTLFGMIRAVEKPNYYEIIDPSRKAKMYIDGDLKLKDCTTTVYSVEEYVESIVKLLMSTLSLDESSVRNMTLLTSCSDEKVSFHLIFHDVVMKTAANAGAVVRRMMSTIYMGARN
jgi:hypothetical protein